MSFKGSWRMVPALAVVLALIVGCTTGGSGPKGSGGSAKQPIKLGDMQWQSLWINNAIAGFIIEEGYGYPVETVELTTPIMQQGLVRGDVDVAMEVWTGNLYDWYNQVVADGKILDLGKVMDRTTQGWYVPAYVIKGDPERGIAPMAPNLRSVADLKEYSTLLADPEQPSKGLLLNCITGWECAKVNRIKLQAYGLADQYNVQEPGASAALDAAIVGNYRKGNPFLAYYWEPTWLMGSLDMIQLEEPPFTEACGAEIRKALDDTVAIKDVTAAAGCAYEDAAVIKAANPAMKERAPEVLAFLEKMQLKTEDLNKVSAYMEEKDVDAEKAALWFFENYQDDWRSWLTSDVAEKVEQALKQAGAKL